VAYARTGKVAKASTGTGAALNRKPAGPSQLRSAPCSNQWASFPLMHQEK